MRLPNVAATAFTFIASVLAYPAQGNRAIDGKLHAVDEQLTVYDASVSNPTRLPGQVVWVDDEDNPTLTTTEMIMVLPTKLAEEASTADQPTTTTTVASSSTETVMVSLEVGEGDTASSPIIMGAKPKGTGQQSKPSSSTDHGKNRGKGDEGGKGPSPSKGEKFGISYAPYRADHGCKSASDVMDDFRRFKGEYSLVRIYGTDCDQVPNVYAAAKDIGVKLMMGIWDINAVVDEASKIVVGLDSDWDIVHSVGVGNELVNNGEASPQQVIDAMNQARKTLRSSGFQGPVVTVDTFIAVESHPELCVESDYCAVNAHAFFDSTMAARDAGEWLQKTVQRVKSAVPSSKHVVVTETGWPTDGVANGMAIPGLANQKTALDSIKRAFADEPSDVVLFSAFNDLWKPRTMATFNVDQHWGVGGAIAKSDFALM